MSDPGFLVRGRGIRRELDELVRERQEKYPARRITRSEVVRELLESAIARERRRSRPSVTVHRPSSA